MNITTSNVPDWANGCPMWIVEKAIKDSSYYKGLSFDTYRIGVMQEGDVQFFDLDKPLLVTVTEIDLMEYTPPYINIYWKVSLPPESDAKISEEMGVESVVDLNPYIPGFFYYLDPEETTLWGYQRSWEG